MKPASLPAFGCSTRRYSRRKRSVGRADGQGALIRRLHPPAIHFVLDDAADKFRFIHYHRIKETRSAADDTGSAPPMAPIEWSESVPVCRTAAARAGVTASRWRFQAARCTIVIFWSDYHYPIRLADSLRPPARAAENLFLLHISIVQRISPITERGDIHARWRDVGQGRVIPLNRPLRRLPSNVTTFKVLTLSSFGS